MPVALSVLGAASHGPIPGPAARPNMLSIGDSLMWGQGLSPDHRFRELVRQRISGAGAAAVELSMARSGAALDPANPDNSTVVAARDRAVADSLLVQSVPHPFYAPDRFTREVPYSSLTARSQLAVARDLLIAGPHSSPDEIRLIILDGGINDINVINIISPAGAIADGEVLTGWAAWLLERSRDEVEPEMFSTLAQALSDFPNATIVVNGYFPIFSSQSMFSAVQVTSYGVLNSTLAAVASILSPPVSLLAVAEASRVWQVVSNEHLRRAIRRVRAQFPGRIVTFARSHIEGGRCLFAPQTWLWGYSAIPPTIPTNIAEWVQWVAGASPEDEVIPQRIARCAALTSGFDSDKCRLASIGHPNVLGAVDYASSIIEALEDEDILASSLDACTLAQRRRIKSCVERQDARDYRCVASNEAMARACGRIIGNMIDRTKSQARKVANDIRRARDHMLAAGNCLANAVGGMADIARNQFSAAAGDLGNAGTRLNEALRCWNEADDELRTCANAEAQAIARCDADYDVASNGVCNIVCTSFGNCNTFSRLNPYRYVCRTLRAACEAGAAAARFTCLGGAFAIRETCRGLAHAEGATCRAGVVLGDTVCSVARGTAAVGNALLAGARAGLGLVTATLAVASGLVCAAGQVGAAATDVFVAGGRVLVGAAWNSVLVGVYGACRAGQLAGNGLCRLSTIGAVALCHAGASVAHGACRVLSAPRPAVTRAGLPF